MSMQQAPQGSASLQGLLYLAMANISDCDLALQKQLLQLVAGYADVMTDTVNRFVETANAAAHDIAKAGRDKSWGDLAGGVVGTIGTIGIAGTAMKTSFSSSQIEGEMGDLEGLSAQLKGGKGSVEDVSSLAEFRANGGLTDQGELDDLLNKMESDPSSMVKNFNEASPEVRAAAVETSSITNPVDNPKRHENILNNIKTRQDSLKGQVDGERSTFNNASQGIHAFVGASKGISDGVAGMYQAGAQQKGTEEQTSADVLKQLASQLAQGQGSNNQQASEEKQNAQQASLGYGSLQQTHA